MDCFFKLQASYISSPSSYSVLNEDAGPDVGDRFERRLMLSKKHYDELTLSEDFETACSFGGILEANVIILESDEKCVVKLTSADGTKQIVPVDDLLILVSALVPVTAIDLVRRAGVTTNIKVFLGELVGAAT
jgi:hypothetical protein